MTLGIRISKQDLIQRSYYGLNLRLSLILPGLHCHPVYGFPHLGRHRLPRQPRGSWRLLRAPVRRPRQRDEEGDAGAVMTRQVLVLVATLLLSAGYANARTWYVLPDGSGDAPTIRAAVDSAADGDVVELASGYFMGEGNKDVDFLGKAITIRSETGDPSTCTMDCQNVGRGFGQPG